MHRSGTSAIAGMLQEMGVELGPVSERNRFNPRGNREIVQLNRLHDRVLERSGGSWSRPPERMRARPWDRWSRNRILRTIEGETIGVKDPRMLICMDFWRDLDPLPIGVIRNPVAVRDSLERRAHERPRKHPQLSGVEWEALWRTYNRALLSELRREPFPVIDFDRRAELDEQARAALRFHGVEPAGESAFFDPGLAAAGDSDWRKQVLEPATLDLWNQLAALSEGAAARPG